MYIEEEVRDMLRKGYTPQWLVENGYSKSIIYNVYHSMNQSATTKKWIVYYRFNKDRYLPGDNVIITYSVQNNSDFDLYLYRIYVWAEWMHNYWIVQNVNTLIKSGTHTQFTIPFQFQIPPDLELEEYELSFGIEYIPSTQYQPTLEWSEPIFIHVKKPPSGIKVFLSHSTRDMILVRQIKKELDKEGIEVIIAEDLNEPGVELEWKFKRLIDRSTMVLALLTPSAVKSEWVIKEITYAYQVRKPIIPFKEKGVQYSSELKWLSLLEWVEFDYNDPIQFTLKRIMYAIKKVQERIQVDILQNVLLFGVFFVLLGIGFSLLK